ncbi:hypothetical protein F4V57_07615 [Acinetobacter qingfengensis]|uniref:hypothetical protein n=1 Tax=Acinetobacter qingfengensis TaxID=1262585 RepID=UPI00114D3230|nr:hypothetical protein [Acinetobacter qingfengensis]KAA8733908.1 hypothetical protein F4V57_07615 [Acinetobacter qingfengensis]
MHLHRRSGCVQPHEIFSCYVPVCFGLLCQPSDQTGVADRTGLVNRETQVKRQAYASPFDPP